CWCWWRASSARCNRDLQAERSVRVVMRGVVEIAGDHEGLPELLLERHAAEQVAHAVGDGQACVAVRQCVGRRRPRLGGGGRGSKGDGAGYEESLHVVEMLETWWSYVK